MIKECTELTSDEIIEAYLLSCKQRVNDIKSGKYSSDNKEEKEEAKKKSETKIKKLYPTYSKIALLLGCIILFGSMLATFFVPDIGEVIMAIIESLDPFKQFRGGRALDPSDYVMFIK